MQRNESGLNVSRYLPTRDHMQCFRSLEKMFLHENKTPLDLKVHCSMRMNAAHPGRSLFYFFSELINVNPVLSQPVVKVVLLIFALTCLYFSFPLTWDGPFAVNCCMPV